MMTKKQQKTKLYQHLVMQIKELIKQGEYKEGDKLPSEMELCNTYNISRATVRRALVELEKEKLIISRQGSGIYVSPHLFQQSLKKFYSFSKEMRKLGKTPNNNILSFEKIVASERICSIMNMLPSTTMLQIIRLRLADKVPYMYATTYLPAERFGAIKQAQIENNDLYALMQNEFNIIFTKAIEQFYPTFPKPLIASYLKISKNIPCMHLTRLTHELNGIVEYTESIVRGDKFTFSVELEN